MPVTLGRTAPHGKCGWGPSEASPQTAQKGWLGWGFRCGLGDDRLLVGGCGRRSWPGGW